MMKNKLCLSEVEIDERTQKGTGIRHTTLGPGSNTVVVQSKGIKYII